MDRHRQAATPSGRAIGPASPARRRRSRRAVHRGAMGRARAALIPAGRPGRLPLVVGGTGLYISRLSMATTTPAQPGPPSSGARLADELDAEGLEPLARGWRGRSGRGRAGSTCAIRAACCGASSGPRPEVGEAAVGRRRTPGRVRSSASAGRRRARAADRRARRAGCSRAGCSTRCGPAGCRLRSRAAADDRPRLPRGRRHLAGGVASTRRSRSRRVARGSTRSVSSPGSAATAHDVARRRGRAGDDAAVVAQADRLLRAALS